eukprot:TRINITY_DN9580_c0_g1_i1.p1 TRINITY_DN9580_c0_g1~~TRINITY_DN9580_c0_g1_i1.p1  ORF type:complete len:229 (-),score=56.15 TRINITY_DN9580_c0_g1_i1:26-712(-)
MESMDGYNHGSFGAKLPQKSSSCCGIGNDSPSGRGDLRFSGKGKSMRKKLHDGVKLVILGDVCTGKTSILLRFVKNIFSAYHEATIGASFLTKQMVIKDTPIKLEIWDTAGSERYYSLAPMYYRGAVAAIIVYDVTSQESFLKAQKWVTELESVTDPRPVIALVANKVDLHLQRQVTMDEAQAYSDLGGHFFFECSAKTGTHIEEIFLAIGNELRDRAIAVDRQPRKE